MNTKLNRLCQVLGATASLALAGAALAQATSTNSITLQGKLEGVTGKTVTVIVRFYDAATGGNQVGWVGCSGGNSDCRITLSEVPISAGLFSVNVPVEPTIFNGQHLGQQRFAELTVNGTVLTPRLMITSVPLAMNTLGLTRDVQDRFGIGLTDSLLANLHIRGRGFDTWNTPDQGLLRLEGPDAWYWTKMTFGRRGTYGPTAAIGVASFSYGSVMAFGTSCDYAAGVTNAALKIDHLGRVLVGGGASGAVATDNSVLQVFGAARVNVLTIAGGSDLAEPFPASPSHRDELTPKPGMVMSIDPDHPGSLRVATEAYDARVAGIHSGGNNLPTGMIMGKEGCDLTATGEHKIPLAMTGRVWVYADESNGIITPGDRLTTSGDKPGHAMKATDKSRSDGAVVGKAMTGVDSRTGMVLVLVNVN